MQGIGKTGRWLLWQLVRGLAFGVLRVGITVAIQALGALRPFEIMALTGGKAEGSQDG